LGWTGYSQGNNYSTKKGREEFVKFLGTDNGQTYLVKRMEEYIKATVQPSVTFIPTPEGYAPAVTRGKEIGTIGTPTGVTKPTPAAEAAKIGGLEGLQNDVKSIKALAGIGTKKEMSDWTGPVSVDMEPFRKNF